METNVPLPVSKCHGTALERTPLGLSLVSLEIGLGWELGQVSDMVTLRASFVGAPVPTAPL